MGVSPRGNMFHVCNVSLRHDVYEKQGKADRHLAIVRHVRI
jgi:hypothetical protein